MSFDATRGFLIAAPVASVRPEPPHSLDDDGFDGRTGPLLADHEAAGLPGDDAVAPAGRTGDGPARPQGTGRK
jgi:hypothetical protein